MSSALLETVKLRVAVPGRALIEDFSAAIARGEFWALLGTNGAGKSLLLRTLAGMRAADQGGIRLDGHDIATLTRRDIAIRLGFLPQDPDAAPQGHVGESVLLGRFAQLGLWQAATADDERRVAAALAAVGLDLLAARELATLSGGEQRRAAIARLLVQAPAAYLLDEPTNHLDPAQQLAILEHFRALTRGGAAVVASLHDPNLALRFADRVCLIHGNGSVETLASDALTADHLARLYRLSFIEARAGAHRIMAAS